MTTSTYRDYQVAGEGPQIVATSEQYAAAVTILVKPGSSRSPRTGRLPRGQESARREAMDAAYREQMAAARRQLAEVAYGPDVDSLAKLRLSRGMSQQQLAEAMGTSQPYIAKVEAGHVRIFLDTAQRLAAALDVNLDSLSSLLERPEVHPQALVSK